MRFSQGAEVAAFSPDGSQLFAGGKSEAKCRALTAVAEGSPEDRILLAQAETGLKRDPSGAIREMDPEEWQLCRRQVAERPELDKRLDLSAWHRAEGDRYERDGRWFAAWWHWTRLTEGRSPSATDLFRRGRAAARAGQHEAALADLSEAIQRDSGNSELRRERGIVLTALNRNAGALADLNAAVGHQPDQWQNWHARANLYLRMGEFERAASDLDRATGLPDVPDSLRTDLAIIWLKLGRTADYRAICRLLVKRAELSVDIAFIAHVVWTCALAQEPPVATGRLVDLSRHAKHSLILLIRNNYAFARAYAAALYRAGRFEEAVKVLDEALAQPQNANQPRPAAWLFLAMAHHQCQREKQAKQWFQKARTWMDLARQPAPGRDTLLNGPSWEGLDWTEQFALELLRGHAEALLQIHGSRDANMSSVHQCLGIVVAARNPLDAAIAAYVITDKSAPGGDPTAEMK
jgi:tetratricopeptide (TPR) repeat protein